MIPKLPDCSRLRTLARCVGLAVALALASAGGAYAAGDRVADAEPAEAKRASERDARRLLEAARLLEREGRIDAALRTAERALELAPTNLRVLRLQARLLDASGRGDEAERLRARADALAPPPADPPDAPLPAIAGRPAGSGLLVIVLPSREGASTRAASRSSLSPEALDDAFAERVALRLPGARIAAPPATLDPTIPAFRAWLDAAGPSLAISLRIERAHCLDTIKDGRFGLAALRVGSASGVREVRSIHDDETLDPSCPSRQVERALETVLGSTEFERELAAAATRSPQPASRAEVHRLFPEFAEAIEAELIDGRRQLAEGRFTAARQAFLRAARIDPDHLDARSFLVEVERSLELAAEIARLPEDRRAPGSPDRPADGPSLGRHPNAAQLDAERNQRNDLLASLALLGADATAPRGDALARLPDGVLPPDDTLGVVRARAALARNRAGAEPDAAATLAVREWRAPDGALLARYFLDADQREATPILVEEDTRGDARPDRYVAWQSGRPSELWETNRTDGLPDVHIVYGVDAEGRATVQRIELTRADRAEPVRVFLYRDGVLRSDFSDVDEDGRFDEIVHFDADGVLVLRETDSDGDGRVDVRSLHRGGRLEDQESRGPGIEADAP